MFTNFAKKKVSNIADFNNDSVEDKMPLVTKENIWCRKSDSKHFQKPQKISFSKNLKSFQTFLLFANLFKLKNMS